MIDFFLKYLASNRLMAVLFFVFPAAMGFGTFIESWYSTDTAKIWIYNAWWFELLMVLMAINFVGNIFIYRLMRKEKWAVLLLHLSFLLILLGALSQGIVSVAAKADQLVNTLISRLRMIFFMVVCSSRFSMCDKVDALRQWLGFTQATPPGHQQEKAEIKQCADLRNSLIDQGRRFNA